MKIELELPKEGVLDEKERRAHNAAIFATFPRLERDIKAKMYEQLINTYSIGIGVADTKDKVGFEIVRGNGIMEGMAILLEKWKIDAQAHEADAKPEEKFDEHEVIGEI